MISLRKWLICLLHKIEGKLLKIYNKEEYINRLDIVKSFLETDIRFSGKAIIEGGRFNYFELPDGGNPKFDFAIPEMMLFIIVGDVRSADWSEARERGVSRVEWEAYQELLAYNIEKMKELEVPILIILNWKEPCSFLHLKGRVNGEIINE